MLLILWYGPDDESPATHVHQRIITHTHTHIHGHKKTHTHYYLKKMTPPYKYEMRVDLLLIIDKYNDRQTAILYMKLKLL